MRSHKGLAPAVSRDASKSTKEHSQHGFGGYVTNYSAEASGSQWVSEVARPDVQIGENQTRRHASIQIVTLIDHEESAIETLQSHLTPTIANPPELDPIQIGQDAENEAWTTKQLFGSQK